MHSEPLATKRLPGKRLALFFDGTWNNAEDNTNVWRLNLMLADRGEDGVPQRKFYDAGVGTSWFDQLTGGAFGYGLSTNVRDGYRWLMEHYDPGDEIFLFGFSRGAFTARSLAGVIARCGLLKPDAPMSFAQLYERYQRGDRARPLYRLKYLRDHGETEFDFEEKVLLDHTHYDRNLIKLVGVWDTVGTLGINLGKIPGISRRTLRFHNTHLSKIVQHNYQALAVDEYRKPYWAILWTKFTPAITDAAETMQPDERHVEQRWFAGAHSNVGGGYRNDLLPQRPLAWLQEKARACGLAFRSHISVSDADLSMPVRESYGDFLWGLFKWFSQPYVRWIMSERVRKRAHWKGTTRIEDGEVHTVNERIDLSVLRRCKLDAGYRPPGLLKWAKRRHLDLEAIIADPEKFPQYWSPVTQPGIQDANGTG